MKKVAFAFALSSLLLPRGASAQTTDSAEDVPADDTSGEAGGRELMEHDPSGAGHGVQTPAEDEEGHWYDDLTMNVFADAFYMVDWNFPDRADATSLVPHRGYDFTNGFGLAFAGIDLAYQREHWGATVNLRFGQGAQRLLIGTGADADSNQWGLRYVSQAYASWMPNQELMVDLGQFGTPYGAEVAESWLNMNYSRSALYYLMQPFYHTGLRATWQASDSLMLRGIVVNGINNGVDSNFTPYFGVQAGFTPSDSFSLYAGYLTGSPQNAIDQTTPTPGLRHNGDFEHFFDLVANVSVGDFRLVGNADFWLNPSNDNAIAGGVSLTAGYTINDWLGIAGRVDYLFNPDGYFLTPYENLVTGTLTADIRPFDTDNMVLRIEHRIEWADEPTFPKHDFEGSGQASALWNATTFSLVVQTGN